MPFLTLIHPDHGGEIEVEFKHYPRQRGLRGQFGEPETPDDEECIVILQAWNEHGEVVDTSDFETEIHNTISQHITQGALE